MRLSIRSSLRPLVFWGLVCMLLGLLAATFSTRHTVCQPAIDLADKIIAESADAYIAYDPDTQTWEIGNSKIRRRMRYRAPDGYRLIGLTNVQTGIDWLAAGNVLNTGLRLVLDGRVMYGSDPSFTLQGYTAHTHADGSLELQVALTHEMFTAHLHYVLFPWIGIIEQWVTVENTGQVTLQNLTALDSISVALRPSPDPLTLYWVQGLSPAIKDPIKKQPLPILRLNSLRLTEGVRQELGSYARSSEDSMGWFALLEPSMGEGLVGGIEWSGAWRMQALREQGQTILRAGMVDLKIALAPGETFASPRRFLGFFVGDLDDAANASHTFARTYLMRRSLPADFPWTQFNTWYAYGISLDEAQLVREVDAAANLGLEVFTIDAGWYAGSPPAGDFGWGLGTWRENRDKFPSGLSALSDYVHEKGLRFGLWVEPERVDLRYVGPGQEIAWAWLAPGSEQIVPETEELAPTAQICLGNPAAQEWMKQWLSRLIVEYHVDWLKWDNNIYMSCDPPGEPGAGNYAHVQGLYRVLDFLRAQFPDLVIENCASGGNRMDYALMRRTDIGWLSDATDPSYRVRYHLAGASYPFPPEYLNTWLVDSAFEPLSETIEAATWRAWLRSRMMGAFGISAPIAEWTPELRIAVATEIEQYKNVRATIANGKIYRLLPQSDLAFPDLEEPLSPDATEFINAANNTGAVFMFRGAIPWQQRRLRLKGLEVDTVYEITSLDRSTQVMRTGHYLMTQGIQFRYDASRPSLLLWIRPVVSNDLALTAGSAP